jgi:hypothetical protein
MAHLRGSRKSDAPGAREAHVRPDRRETIRELLADLLEEETDPFGAHPDASEAKTDEHYFPATLLDADDLAFAPPEDVVGPIEDQHRLATAVVRIRRNSTQGGGTPSKE